MKSENTKYKILYTALELFSSLGFNAVSVRDIAGKIGITQSALYKHYKSKQDIFDSILRKMEERDFEKAQQSQVPDTSYQDEPIQYKSISLDNVKAFTKDMFHYWTQDEFSVYFRKMLTIEQYSNEKISLLYNQYLLSGPLAYTEDLFREIGCKNYKAKAIEFYSPVLMLIYLYDTAENKTEIIKKAENHIENFNLEE